MDNLPDEDPVWTVRVHAYSDRGSGISIYCTWHYHNKDPVILYRWRGRPYIDEDQLMDITSTVANTLQERLAIQGVFRVRNQTE